MRLCTLNAGVREPGNIQPLTAKVTVQCALINLVRNPVLAFTSQMDPRLQEKKIKKIKKIKNENS